MGWWIAIVIFFILTPLILQIGVYRGVLKLRALGSKAWPGLFSALFLLIAVIFSVLLLQLGWFDGISKFLDRFGQRSLFGIMFLGQLLAGGTWLILKKMMMKRLIAKRSGALNIAPRLLMGISVLDILFAFIMLVVYIGLTIFALSASGGE